eukprot:511690-Amphidinium_carterae.1
MSSVRRTAASERRAFESASEVDPHQMALRRAMLHWTGGIAVILTLSPPAPLLGGKVDAELWRLAGSGLHRH